jgi:5,10-methylenetetrahydrofolate reductase
MSFKKRLDSGEFVVLAEMDTPKGVDISELVTNARRIKGRVDAVSVPDMSNGVMRMSALGGGVLMQQQGLEAIMQICPRDRNRLALQGDVLAAHVLGIQNLVVTPGEDISYGDHIEAKTVGDLDEAALLKAIKSLEEGADLAGIDLKGIPSYLVGATMAPWADDKALEKELDLTRAKVEAGAQFVISPPVFDLDRFTAFQGQAKDLGVPIIPTVFLLKSVGVARYMAAHLPGTFISEDLIKRIRKAPDRVQECIKVAGETVRDLKGLAQGVNIVTLGWEYRLPAVLDVAGI